MKIIKRKLLFRKNYFLVEHCFIWQILELAHFFCSSENYFILYGKQKSSKMTNMWTIFHKKETMSECIATTFISSIYAKKSFNSATENCNQL